MRLLHLFALCHIYLLYAVSGSAASTWTLIPDGLNYPAYDGTSGLAASIDETEIRIYGTNSDTPADALVPEDALVLWHGLAAQSNQGYESVEVQTTGGMVGSGSGYVMRVTLWQDTTRFISYGLELDRERGTGYLPSRWIALGGWPEPSIMSSWTQLGTPIADHNALHSYKVQYDGATVLFWLDGNLVDSVSYVMDFVTVRLSADARALGDSVDATFTEVSISGSPVPEPASILALFCGIGGLAWRRRGTR